MGYCSYSWGWVGAVRVRVGGIRDDRVWVVGVKVLI